jgi:hypothetical protein
MLLLVVVPECASLVRSPGFSKAGQDLDIAMAAYQRRLPGDLLTVVIPAGRTISALSRFCLTFHQTGEPA